MDAAVRELAPIGTLARDRRLATAVAVAVSLIALGAASGGSSPGSWPWATTGLALLAASTFVLVGVRWVPRSARWFGRMNSTRGLGSHENVIAPSPAATVRPSSRS